MKKQYLLTAIVAIFLFFGVFTSNASAAGIASYYIGPGETYMVPLDGQDRLIKNDNAYAIYVPVRTLAEQQSFLNNSFAGVVICPYMLFDLRDGQQYPVAVIGSQCWMAKNLNFNPGGAGSWCYNNNSSYCYQHGRLYDQPTAINAHVCPSGWKLPTDADYYTLESHFAAGTCDAARIGWGCEPAGVELKNGVFRAPLPPSGYREYPSGFFRDLGYYTYFWSSTAEGTIAFFRSLGFEYGVRRAYINRGFGYSVRCLKE